MKTILLEELINGKDDLRDIVMFSIEKWLDRFNKSFVLATPSQKEKTLSMTAKIKNEKLRNRIEFFVK